MTPAPDQPEGQRPRRRRYSGKSPSRFEDRYKELHPQAHPGIVEHVRSRGRTPAGSHVPILVAEIVTALGIAPGQIVADCTLGYGGHAEAFLRLLGPKSCLLALDVDGQQLERTAERLAAAGHQVTVRRSNFAGLAKVMAQLGIAGFDVIFADLGVSSMQLDESGRGFSYKQDGPLDMRMDDRTALSAADHLAKLSEEELSTLLWELADEEDHAAIAHAIVQRREGSRVAGVSPARPVPISRTLELSELVFQAKGIDMAQYRRQAVKGEAGPHPAAKTFQALRILVNRELASLRELLRVASSCLSPGGRIGILTFHSGEDRLVKNAFAAGLRDGVYEAASPEPLRPSRQEIYDNPRSSPAKFRWARKA